MDRNHAIELGMIPAIATIASEGSHSPALSRSGTKLKKPSTLEGRYKEGLISISIEVEII